MGIRMPETCWAVSRRQTINLLLIVASIWFIHLNVWRYTDLQTIITINWFLRNFFRCSCYATSKWKIIFERLIRKDVKGKVRASIIRHLDRRKEITRHSSPHNFLRLGIRTRDHTNSKYEHKIICLLDFHRFIYWWIYRKLTLRLLMSYIHGAPILDVSRSHTTTQHSR